MGTWTAGHYLPPPIITITAEASGFREAMERARMAMALLGEVWLFVPRTERPVDRARRLRVDRLMRLRARRAARHGRVLQ